MTREAFDCIVVGARCAGAPLAAHLARGGMRVCIVDAAKLPSDQPFSTHAIQPGGMDRLDELGVGDAVRAVAPVISVNRFVLGGSVVDIRLRNGRPMYCPRRTTLDSLLANAAVAAGAELRDETAVVDLLHEDGRVRGVRVRHKGSTADLRARLVVGADGRNSTVAKRVGAAEYNAVESQRAGYWGYFPVTPAVERLGFQAYIEIRHADLCFFFRTESGLAVAGALAPPAVARTWTRDVEGSVRARLADSDVTSSLVDSGARPVGRLVGLMKLRGFFRVPVGPGWALVGDAGLHKDPTAGLGITDALRDAKALSIAILDGREAALEVYWRKRDVDSTALYANATDLGSLDYHNPLNEMILRHIGSKPEFLPRLERVVERELSPYELVPPWQAFAWTAAALLRAKKRVFGSFLNGGKRSAQVARELSARSALLEEAKRRLERDDTPRAGASEPRKAAAV